MKPDTDHDLPGEDMNQLPPDARAIYDGAFDEAWRRYGRSPRDESRARALAWAAVKRRFHQDDARKWVEGAAEEQPLHTGHLDDRRIF